MYFDKAGRHYWFAENLIKSGYMPTIFCASTNHFSDNSVDMKGKKYITNFLNSVSFVFVKTPEYKGNGKSRIINMVSFYKNLFPVAKEYAKTHGKPDVILASSVHPLTLVAGIKIAKKFGVPCICEVRDLWPETLVAMGKIKRNSIPARLLYALEKFIYKKADRLIFTFPGGKDYVESIGLDSSNVRYINNGVDLEQFNKNKIEYIYNDADLNDESIFKIIYTGAMGQANALNYLIKAAQAIQCKGIENIRFILFGDGYQKIDMEKYVQDNNINNVVFKGKVEKKYIPNILSKSGLKGIIDIDIFKISGEYYISEVNPRFGGGYPHAYECGVDIPKMIINNLKGCINEVQIDRYSEGVYMMKYNEVKIVGKKDRKVKDFGIA